MLFLGASAHAGEGPGREAAAGLEIPVLNSRVGGGKGAVNLPLCAYLLSLFYSPMGGWGVYVLVVGEGGWGASEAQGGSTSFLQID